MKQVMIEATGIFDFYEKVKAASKSIGTIFRDGQGFIATANGQEVRITCTDRGTRGSYESFFQTGTPLKALLDIPEDADFGMTPKPVPMTEAEARAFADQATNQADFELKKAEIIRRNGGVVPAFMVEPTPQIEPVEEEPTLELPPPLDTDKAEEPPKAESGEEKPSTATEPVVETPPPV